MDAAAYLESLREALLAGGWRAEVTQGRRGRMLHVEHPRVPRLNDDVVCDGSVFRWAWGPVICPVTDIDRAADRVRHVLREVG
jgi:hypothetical protein